MRPTVVPPRVVPHTVPPVGSWKQILDSHSTGRGRPAVAPASATGWVAVKILFPRQAAAARHRASSSGCAADAATAHARLPAKSSCASPSLPAPSAAIRTATEALEAIAIAGTRSGEGGQGEAEPPALFCCRLSSCSELGRDVHLVQPQDCFAHIYV